MSGRSVPKYGPRSAALREATLVECKRRVRQWGGDPNEHNLRALQRLVEPSLNDKAGAASVALYRDFTELVERIELFLDAYAARELAHPVAEQLQKLVANLPERPKWHARMMQNSRTTSPPTRRSIVVGMYFDERQKWWRPEREGKPSASELAVVSILAGSWPEASNRDTPSEVIRAEARAIKHHLDGNQKSRPIARKGSSVR
jgi:hypothetical protein